MKVDTLDAASVAAALAGCDAVVNCVAGSAAAIADGARVLFECAAQRSPKPVVVHLSTISVYGSATGRVDEHEPPRADIGWYGKAKIEAERHAAAYAAGGGSVVVLRPGIVYGPDSVLWTTASPACSGAAGSATSARPATATATSFTWTTWCARSWPRCATARSTAASSTSPTRPPGRGTTTSRPSRESSDTFPCGGCRRGG